MISNLAFQVRFLVELKFNYEKFTKILIRLATSKFGMSPEQAEETIANPETRAVNLKRYYENLNPGWDLIC